MVLTLVTAAFVAAAPVQVRIAAPGLTAINLDPKLAEFYQEHLAQRLGFAGVSVTTSKEIAGVIGLERQKQLLGCGEQGSCMTELAGALGVDGLLIGSLAKVADTFQLNLKIVSANDASTLSSYAVHTDDEEALLKQLNVAAKDMARELYAKLNRGPAPSPTAADVDASSGKVRRASWVPIALGGAFGVASAILLVLANQEAGVLHPAGGTVDLTTAQQAATQGNTYQLLAVAGFALGGACLATGLFMFLFGGPTGAFQTAFVPTAGGGTFVLGATF